MESKKEIKGVFYFTNNEGTQIFGEGDNVICRTEDGRRYVGSIIAVSNRYQENGETKHEEVICIGTFKDNISSSEIIKIADIASMCRIPKGDMLGYPITNEDLDRYNFINLIASLGYVKEAVMLYERMKELISLYNIPLSIMLVDVIQKADLNVDGKNEEEFTDISSKLLTAVARFFQRTTDKIKEAQIS